MAQQVAIPFHERLTCSVTEACIVSGMGRTTLYGLMKSGKLETVTVAKRRLIVVRSLIANLDPASPYSNKAA